MHRPGSTRVSCSNTFFDGAEMPTITLPGLDLDLQKLSEEFTKTQSAWRVILHNDNYNTMENVVLWLQKATGCSLEQAEHITYVAHTNGKAVCFSGNKE